MKWAILQGGCGISGGNYVTFEHALGAMRAGVEVYMVTESPLAEGELDWHPEAKTLRWVTLDSPVINSTRFEAAIATWWETVCLLHRVNAGAYAWLVQSVESRFYPEADRVSRALADAACLLPLHVITEASWIERHLEETFGRRARVVRNGVRKDIYRAEGDARAPRQPGRLRVLVEGLLGSPIKNVQRTIELCRASEADEVWLLTASRVRSYPGADRVFSCVPVAEVPKIYRSCDLLVKLSFVEGMFSVPMEMFHCGGTAITYEVTGGEEYIRDGENARVVPSGEEKQVVALINELKRDPARLAQLKEGARRTADAWPGWPQASAEFQRAVSDLIAEPQPEPADAVRKKLAFFSALAAALAPYRKVTGKPTRAARFKEWLLRAHPRAFRAAQAIKQALARLSGAARLRGGPG